MDGQANYSKENSEQIKKRPLITPLEKHVRYVAQKFEGTEKMADALSRAHKVNKILPHGQKVNSLSGRCDQYSRDIEAYAEGRFRMNFRRARGMAQLMHTWLTVTTYDAGELVVDPTLGQFIQYPHIFVGTLDELREEFLSEEREFLFGTRIEGTDQPTTREGWFEYLYK